MLMVFTRSKDSRLYGFFRRIFRRGKKAEARAVEGPVPVAVPLDYPKAAE
jgi:hypothetical protein